MSGEQEAAVKAEKEIRSQKEARAKRMEKAKETAVRKSLPENLECKTEYVYPQGYNRFNKLSRYHLDGRYNIDNNGIENAVRSVALGKNYLFCQNDDTAESTTIIYSFMGCCKASGVGFHTWMIYFLYHVHDYDQDYTKYIADLLPDNLKEAGLL